MNKVSVHILFNPEYNVHGDNITKILRELSKSNKVSPTVLPGVPGHVGESRIKGFMSAREKYCCYIDDDDKVLDPTYFHRAVTYLDANPDVGMYAGREMIHFDKVKIEESLFFSGEFVFPSEIDIIHHMQVYRTDVVKRYLNFLKKYKYAPERCLHAKMMLDGVKIKAENNINYLWRKDEGNTHKQDPADTYTESNDIRNLWGEKFALPF